ncbi:MAG TPA: glycogen debranching N-terminal domain-containing protein, partial [Pseudonocardiaceae bacterium]
MTGRHLLVHDGVFAALDAAGDVHGTSGTTPDGLFVRDTRHLSLWRLTVDGHPPTLLAPGVLAPEGTRDHPPGYAVFRRQAVDGSGLAEQVRLVNHDGEPRTLRVGYLAGVDFADQFELRRDDREYIKPDVHRSCRVTATGVEFGYRRGEWLARTVVTARPEPEAVTEEDGRVRLEWTVELPAHGSAELTLAVYPVPGGAASAGVPEVRCPSSVAEATRTDTEAFTTAAPRPGELTGWAELARACEQGMLDLAGLRVPVPGLGGEVLRVPGAGVPWFLTLFGRDSLLASLFALPYRPELAAATLPALAAVQGSRYDASRLEEPGKIVHEVRHGELSHFGQVPYGRYYGTVDATPLFLVLLHAYTVTAGDERAAATLEGHARAAVDWMFTDGGLDEHGYLVYRPDGSGLVNQCWKDSAGAICHPDGTQASGPVAVCEVQGYAYDALRRTAELAERVWGDPAYARRLTAAAKRLRENFHRDFPMPEHDGFPALALDGRRAQVAVLASNAGHLLWSGLVDQEWGTRIGRRLLRPDFFSGWGIRTLAAGQRPYHPLSYHRGSIWPHDNAIVVSGLVRYGLRAEAEQVARALVETAVHNGYRLPEVLAGHSRDEHPEPLPYPHSCSPQAWAAATPLA